MSSGSTRKGQLATFKATSSLSGKQYYAVGFDSSNRGQIVLANAQTVEAMGILQDEPGAGEYGTVLMPGPDESFAIAGGTIHYQDQLTADSNGKLIATTTAGDKIVAVALDEAVSGDRFAVQVVNAYYN